MTTPIAEGLKRIAKGEILSDDWSKEIYSVDASHYSIKPSVIVCPLDEYDLSELCQYGYSRNMSITARGAGTGLLGQSINRTKYTAPLMRTSRSYSWSDSSCSPHLFSN